MGSAKAVAGAAGPVRAPTDNDRGHHGEALEPLWRRVGLHRLRHRVDEVAVEDAALVVRTRVAPAATDLGVVVTYRWTASGGGLRLEVAIAPEGEWPCPLPRVGLRIAVPAGLGRVEWFGGALARPTPTPPGRPGSGGSGHRGGAPDPLPFPQENGNRRDVRWRPHEGGGAASRVRGEPTIDLTSAPGPASARPGPPPPRPRPWRPRLGSTSTSPSRASARHPAAPVSSPLPPRPRAGHFVVRLLPCPDLGPERGKVPGWLGRPGGRDCGGCPRRWGTRGWRWPWRSR